MYCGYCCRIRIRIRMLPAHDFEKSYVITAMMMLLLLLLRGEWVSDGAGGREKAEGGSATAVTLAALALALA
jgi:hypothetical protein